MGKDENDERWKGAQVLSRGLAFMALNHSLDFVGANEIANRSLTTTFMV